MSIILYLQLLLKYLQRVPEGVLDQAHQVPPPGMRTYKIYYQSDFDYSD
ncbi:6812_t:CDS:2, partial [Racocetra fulgida]